MMLEARSPGGGSQQAGAEKGSLLDALVLATSGQETHDAWAT